jgi:arylsulfatase A-like enzyme
MYYPSNIPHAELLVPDDEIFEQFKGQFEEKPYKAGNRAAASYGPDVSISGYCPQDYPKATFAAMISRLDKQVGEIVAKTKELGIYKNTIFFFTSDNGPHGEGGIHPDDFNSNGILRGMKRDLYEGGIRVPMIVSWPDKINKEEVSDHISAFWDILPTLAEIAKTDVPVDIDGLSFLPTLFNKGKQKIHDNLYWEFHSYGGRQAVRKGKWKAVKYNCFNPSKTTIELFDLDQDPSEEIDLAVKYPDILAEMEAIMQKEHSFDPEFPFGK